MMEGYIIYDSLYYANRYIEKINDTPSTLVWDDHQNEDKREAEIL
jgi:hypothetical protein